MATGITKLLGDELYYRFRAQARLLDRSIASVLEELVRGWMEKQKPRQMDHVLSKLEGVEDDPDTELDNAVNATHSNRPNGRRVREEAIQL